MNQFLWERTARATVSGYQEVVTGKTAEAASSALIVAHSGK
jgi:hypothetical protein